MRRCRPEFLKARAEREASQRSRRGGVRVGTAAHSSQRTGTAAVTALRASRGFRSGRARPCGSCGSSPSPPPLSQRWWSLTPRASVSDLAQSTFPKSRALAHAPSPPFVSGVDRPLSSPSLNSSEGAEGRRVSAGKMPLELTQSRVQKIWIPVDHRPSLPRCECRRARGPAAGEGAPRGEPGHCVAGAGRALLCRLPSAGALGPAGRRPPRRPRAGPGAPRSSPPASPWGGDRGRCASPGRRRGRCGPAAVSAGLGSARLAPGAQGDPETASAPGAPRRASASRTRGKGCRLVPRPGPPLLGSQPPFSVHRLLPSSLPVPPSVVFRCRLSPPYIVL